MVVGFREWNIRVGDLVKSLMIVAKVVELRPNGDVILLDDDGFRWRVRPSKITAILSGRERSVRE